jgi:hypothetical protein
MKLPLVLQWLRFLTENKMEENIGISGVGGGRLQAGEKVVLIYLTDASTSKTTKRVKIVSFRTFDTMAFCIQGFRDLSRPFLCCPQSHCFAETETTHSIVLFALCMYAFN